MLWLWSSLALAECGPDARTVSAATFNTWGLPAPIAWDRRGRFPGINTYLADAGLDVVGLQEVWAGARGLLSIDGLRMPALWGGDTGLALVSAHPVDDLRMSPFRSSRGVDALKAKGLLQGELSIDGSAVTVLVTHLQAGPGSWNGSVRTRQVDELLGALSPLHGPVLMLGDFNFYAENPDDVRSWERLSAAGLVDAAADAGALSGTYPGGTERFDRVFVREGHGGCASVLEAEVVELRDTRGPLSDHHAVRAVVRLEE